jgi:hypothetical protein
MADGRAAPPQNAFRAIDFHNENTITLTFPARTHALTLELTTTRK